MTREKIRGPASFCLMMEDNRGEIQPGDFIKEGSGNICLPLFSYAWLAVIRGRWQGGVGWFVEQSFILISDRLHFCFFLFFFINENHRRLVRGAEEKFPLTTIKSLQDTDGLVRIGFHVTHVCTEPRSTSVSSVLPSSEC